jgi:hypothetical protein
MGGIESTQGEKKALLPKTESKPASGPTVVGVTQGNLPPAVENLPQHTAGATTHRGRAVQVPSLDLPQLVIDKDLSIKLVLPKNIAADESMARAFTDAIFWLFLYETQPLLQRDPEVLRLDNLYAGEGFKYKRTRAVLDFLNGFIELLEACGIPPQYFLSVVLRNYDRSLPTLEEFLTDYLGLNPVAQVSEPEKIINQCKLFEANFDLIFKNLTSIFEKRIVASLDVGKLSRIAASIHDHTVPDDASELWDLSRKESTQRSCEMMVLYVVLRHQQSWLSKSPDLNHLEMAAKATVLLHKIARGDITGVPTPPDPSDLIIDLAARAMKAVSQEDLEDAVHCAEILETLAEVSDDARTRLDKVKAVIAQYDAEAEKVAGENKFDG